MEIVQDFADLSDILSFRAQNRAVVAQGCSQCGVIGRLLV